MKRSKKGKKSKAAWPAWNNRPRGSPCGDAYSWLSEKRKEQQESAPKYSIHSRNLLRGVLKGDKHNAAWRAHPGGTNNRQCTHPRMSSMDQAKAAITKVSNNRDEANVWSRDDDIPHSKVEKTVVMTRGTPTSPQPPQPLRRGGNERPPKGLPVKPASPSGRQGRQTRHPGRSGAGQGALWTPPDPDSSLPRHRTTPDGAGSCPSHGDASKTVDWDGKDGRPWGWLPKDEGWG